MKAGKVDLIQLFEFQLKVKLKLMGNKYFLFLIIAFFIRKQ